jgi:glycosyltransferase involved in cell wall biosynthesis
MAEPPSERVHLSGAEGAVLAGVRSRDELAALLAAAWIAVASDAGDATALGPIEALAAGTPAVVPAPLAAAAFGTARVGSRFDPGSPRALADAMEQALELAVEPRIARACRDRAHRFAWDRTLPAYEELYRAASERGEEGAIRLAGGR